MHATAGGLLRGIKSERPDLNLCVLDLDQDVNLTNPKAHQLILDCATNLQTKHMTSDLELRFRAGVRYFSRVLPDDCLNRDMRPEYSVHEYPQELLGSWDDLSTTPFTLHLGDSSNPESVWATKLTAKTTNTVADSITVNLKAMSFSSGAAAIVRSKQSSLPTDGFAGIVTAVTKGSTKFGLGDHVYGSYLGPCRSQITIPVSWCGKMDPCDSFESMAGFSTPFCNAIHVLEEILRLSSEESILIRSTTSGISEALIEVATMSGATILVSVEEPEQKHALHEAYPALLEENILVHSAENEDLTLSGTTCKEGIDAAVTFSNNYAGDGLLRLLKPYGRLVNLQDNYEHEAETNKYFNSRHDISYIPFNFEAYASSSPQRISR